MLEEATELGVVPAFVDVPGDGVAHHAGHRAPLDTRDRPQALGQLDVEPQQDVLGLAYDIKIS